MRVAPEKKKLTKTQREVLAWAVSIKKIEPFRTADYRAARQLSAKGLLQQVGKQRLFAITPAGRAALSEGSTDA